MWLEKREVAAYYLLYSRFNLDETFDVLEAVDVLSNYFPRKVAFSIFRRLVKVGLIKRRGPTEYSLEDLCTWLFDKSKDYLQGRMRRYGLTSGTSSSSSS